MLRKILRKIIGDQNQKAIRQIEKIVQQINVLEPEMVKLSEKQLMSKTVEFKERLAKGESLDDLLVEAFAVVREAGRRVFAKRIFDVQLIGGIILHQGKIAEMKTGEGKTLVATLPAYLNALTGKGVHVVTVNDYLASRDAIEMGKLYNFLGLSCGVVTANTSPKDRQLAYGCDITYGTNNEFWFDYLRDNMVVDSGNIVQINPKKELGKLNFAIVDEVDSILIDEARTPLIISAPSTDSTSKYVQYSIIVNQLLENKHYVIDEKEKTAIINEEGIREVEKIMGIENIYTERGFSEVYHLEAALKAQAVYKKDIDYVIKDGEIMIVDEFTGRLMQGRRYGWWLHQAIEAKEKVNIKQESKTLATISFQNYFRLYKKLAGMTGTAVSEEEEFGKIYGLEVLVVPSNKPNQRKDLHDSIYKNERGKFTALSRKVKEAYENGQPTLVGTISIEKSEVLSSFLEKEKVPHNVLNAKFHEQEAQIIADAGRYKAVTIATNMAGRGTDIILGGNAEIIGEQIFIHTQKICVKEGKISKSKLDLTYFIHPDFVGDSEFKNYELNKKEQATLIKNGEDTIWEQLEITEKLLWEDIAKKITAPEKEIVLEKGWLNIIGSERHESRRIDNQLRGRSGRQGDIGQTQFFVSMDDSLMRLFGSARIQNMMEKFKIPEDMPVENAIIGKSLESAQKKIEAHHFDIRKHLVDYDDVINKHRDIIYKLRRELLFTESEVCNKLKQFSQIVAENLVKNSFDTKSIEGWDFEGLKNKLGGFSEKIKKELEESELTDLKEEKEITALVVALMEKAVLSQMEKAKKVLLDLWQPEEVVKVSLDKSFRNMCLRAIDNFWMGHIDNMTYLKQRVATYGYAQKDPLVIYKSQAFEMFQKLLLDFKISIIKTLLKAEMGHNIRVQPVNNQKTELQGSALKEDFDDSGELRQENKKIINLDKKERKNKGKKVGRNDLCPCGSGKKYKKCCG